MDGQMQQLEFTRVANIAKFLGAFSQTEAKSKAAPKKPWAGHAAAKPLKASSTVPIPLKCEETLHLPPSKEP